MPTSAKWDCAPGTKILIENCRKYTDDEKVLEFIAWLDTVREDFIGVNIYKNSIYLMHHDFLSPLASNGAIAFYRYFIVDTLRVANDSCIQVDFTPNNPQDYGFSGSLYIMADSTYRVKRAEIGFPKRTDVNFVDRCPPLTAAWGRCWSRQSFR